MFCTQHACVFPIFITLLSLCEQCQIAPGAQTQKQKRVQIAPVLQICCCGRDGVHFVNNNNKTKVDPHKNKNGTSSNPSQTKKNLKWNTCKSHTPYINTISEHIKQLTSHKKQKLKSHKHTIITQTKTRKRNKRNNSKSVNLTLQQQVRIQKV